MIIDHQPHDIGPSETQRGDHPQHPRILAAALGELVFHPGELQQNLIRPFEQQFAVAGQFQPAIGSLDQPQRQLALDMRQSLADRRGRDPQRTRRRRQ